VAAYMRWFLGIPVALGIWAILELFGVLALSRPIWSRMPSWARVGLLVALVCLATVLTVWVHRLSAVQNAA
jgi:protein-S-isoprenylcysteine O-methyltransferase Ste14